MIPGMWGLKATWSTGLTGNRHSGTVLFFSIFCPQMAKPHFPVYKQTKNAANSDLLTMKTNTCSIKKKIAEKYK